MDLFSQIGDSEKKEFEVFRLKDGEVWFMRNFLKQKEADDYFNILGKSIHWKQEEIKIYGKTFPFPRKTAWYGYERFNYSYSGLNLNPNPGLKNYLN